MEERARQATAIARWLQIFLAPGQVTELRALHVPGASQALSQFFCTEDVESMAASAVSLEQRGARGIYFVPNPLRPQMLRSLRASHDDDVISRRWLLIDVDSVREDAKHTPATEDEKRLAWEAVCLCRELLADVGLTVPVIGDSGNGWHLNYPVDLPNDDAAKQWARDVLHWLKGECQGRGGKIDTAVYNASRIWRLYGTRSRKGNATPDRPHRWSRLLEESDTQ